MLLWPFLPFIRWTFLPVTHNGGILMPRIAPPIPGVRAEVPITAVIAITLTKTFAVAAVT